VADLDSIDINFWDEEFDYANLEPDEFIEVPTNIAKIFDSNEWEIIHKFCWGLRRMLWPELISKKYLEIRLFHDGESGSGVGPLFFFGNAEKICDLRMTDWPDNSAGVMFLEDSFNFSDSFAADYIEEAGFLGIKEIKAEFLNYQEREFNQDDFEVFFENTFDAEWRLTAIEPEHGFHQYNSADKISIIQCLVEIIEYQEDKFGEQILDICDLISCLAITDKVDQSAKRLLLGLNERVDLILTKHLK
jgi:hypothetical protein